VNPDHYGVDSMALPLRRVALRAPGAIVTADPDVWHYADTINAAALVAQHAALAALLDDHGAEVVWLPEDDDGLADSVFTYDPSFVVPSGAIVLRPGKPLRRGEAALHARFYEQVGIPLLGTIESPGTIEGGDCFWLDPTTLAVGRGYRTNQAGIDQLRRLVAADGIDVVQFDLPHHHGPDACLHLMSVVSVLAADLALVHEPLMPVTLHQLMRGMGFELLAAPDDEFVASAGLSLNVLATAPRRLIAVAGSPRTADLMREAGCDVSLIDGDALCIPCEGGPTCLTRPLLRR
jgi:N-dimethylarginine dimethylaminohydrolase